MFIYLCVEVMDAHLQNNQTAEDDLLASPDRLKGRGHTLTDLSWIYTNMLISQNNTRLQNYIIFVIK